MIIRKKIVLFINKCTCIIINHLVLSQPSHLITELTTEGTILYY